MFLAEIAMMRLFVSNTMLAMLLGWVWSAFMKIAKTIHFFIGQGSIFPKSVNFIFSFPCEIV